MIDNISSGPPTSIATITLRIIRITSFPIKFTGTHINPTNIIVLAIVTANVRNGILEIEKNNERSR